LHTAIRTATACFLAIGCLAGIAGAQQTTTIAPAENEDYLYAKPKDMQWWREAKFGLFVHWGPVSIMGGELSWSRAGERRGRTDRGNEIPAEVYDNLYKKFNPTKFNADKWVALAKAAGMKYIVFGSKHHDGFCMFDTQFTDYKITNSPFNRDICKELADACHRGGIKLGWYYSPVDWYHPDFRTENHARYIEYMHGQLRELCTNYGKIDVIWFDGLGGTVEDWDSKKLFKMIRSLQPQIIINNRAGLPGDYSTPEQEIGQFNTGRPWETCMGIGDRWAYNAKDYTKSLKECVHVLVKTAGGGGNLLLNAGPMETGQFHPLQTIRLQQIGTWLNEYSQSIYNTQGGPFRPGPWGVSTYRDDTVYLHILAWDQGRVTLPPLDANIVDATLLTGGDIDLEQTETGIEIFVHSDFRKYLDTVIVLTLDTTADLLHPVAPPSGSLIKGKPASQAGTGRDDKINPPGNALDDDYGTFWMANMKYPPAQLIVDLGEPKEIGRASLCETLDRVRAYTIDYKVGDKWETMAWGKNISQWVKLDFSPVVAQHVRLNVINAVGNRGPQICEFQLFPPE